MLKNIVKIEESKELLEINLVEFVVLTHSVEYHTFTLIDAVDFAKKHKNDFVDLRFVASLPVLF